MIVKEFIKRQSNYSIIIYGKLRIQLKQTEIEKLISKV